MTEKLPGPVIYRVSAGKEAALLSPLKDRCGGLVVSGHSGAYFRSSVTGLIRTLGVPFFVDPSVWLLARDSDRIRKDGGELRNSIDKYVELLGDEVSRIVRKAGRSLKASDFFSGGSWHEKLLDELLEGVAKAQTTFVDPIRQKTLDELLDLAGVGGAKPKSIAPAFIVAPYFFAENSSDPWYKITVELLRRAVAKKATSPVFGVVCLPKDILDDAGERATIIQNAAQADGTLVWISEFRDSGSESATAIRGYVDLLKGLIALKKPVYVLYGGYPSLLLTKLGLKGVCHGLCYGDSKKIDQPPSEGPPPSRFYLSFSKTKVPLLDAQAMYAAKPKRPCNCSVCAGIGSSKAKWAQVDVNAFFRRHRNTEALPKHHFASCRWDEAQAIGQRTLPVLMKDWETLWVDGDASDPGSIQVTRTVLDQWRGVLSGSAKA